MTNNPTTLIPAPTDQDVQRQLTLEREALETGITNFRNRTIRLEQRGLAGSTDYGKRAAARRIEMLAEGIRQFIADAKKKPGPRAVAVPYLEKLEPEVLAFIALRTVLDLIARRSTMHLTAMSIANNIEDECRFREFEKKYKGLYAKVNENFDKSPWAYSSDRRRSVLIHAANKFKVEWQEWTHSDRVHIGSALISLLISTTGIVEVHRDGDKQYKNSYFLKPSADLMAFVAGFNAEREIMTPHFMPMVIPPRPWTDPFDGGYYDERLCHRLTLVKKTSKGYLKELSYRPMPDVYAGINALQQTPWRVNGALLTVVKEIWEAGLEVKGFPSRRDIPLPPKPADYESNKAAKQAWGKQAGEIYRTNVRAGSKRIQVAKIMYLADKFVAEPTIYFPVQLDFRGRVYSIPLFLNPQGCDLAKALLTFSEGKPLGKGGVFWLGVHLANTYGHDKVSLQERFEWAKANSDRIEATANDPLSDRWWMEADKPFQFLAACIEWLGYLHDGGEAYVCSLPIMVDGSCNGLQHFSAMLRDEVCGAQVNLVPAEKPADVYQAVADQVFDKLRSEMRPDFIDMAVDWLAYGIDRKLCKRPVMILPYGGTREAVRKYILDAVVERATEKNIAHPFGDDLLKAVQYLASVVWDTMKEVVRGPRVAMDWLRDTAKLLAKGNRMIYWTTPSGFWVRQAYPDFKDRRIETKIGQQIVYYRAKEEVKGKVDRRKQAQAVSPNFVHSLDASALVLTILKSGRRGVTQFSAIHDSYGTVAADMQILMDTLRESFVEMYEAHDVLAEFAATTQDALGSEAQVPPVPAKGNLELRGILRSDFFFA